MSPTTKTILMLGVVLAVAVASAAAWSAWSAPWQWFAPAQPEVAYRGEFDGRHVPQWKPEYAPKKPIGPVGPPGSLMMLMGQPAKDIPGSWPRFLGPHYNAWSDDPTPLADAWPEGGPRVLWEKSLGEGHAGAAVDKGRIYILDYDEQRRGDVLVCASLKDGKDIWRRFYPMPIDGQHGISRTVPTVAEGHVVTMGPACHVMCVQAETGQYCWSIDVVKKYGAKVPEWFSSQSPLIDDGKAVFCAGGEKMLVAVALKPADGKNTPKILWETPNPNRVHMTHSSPVPMTLDGVKMYVYCTTGGAVGVDAATGRLLWEWTDWVVRPATAPSPVILPDGRIFLTAGYRAGSAMLQLTRNDDGTFRPNVLYKLKPTQFSMYQHTPVLHGGMLYGILTKTAGPPMEQLVCVNPANGQVKWYSGRDDRFGWGPLLIADGKIFALNDATGELTMAPAKPDGYRRLARAKLLDNGDAWAAMAIVNGRLILRDKKRMICIDLRPQR